MSTQDRLKGIEENWPQRKQFPNATFNINANELDWLIERIKVLEKALRYIKDTESQLSDKHYTCLLAAKEALAGKE